MVKRLMICLCAVCLCAGCAMTRSTSDYGDGGTLSVFRITVGGAKVNGAETAATMRWDQEGGEMTSGDTTAETNTDSALLDAILQALAAAR